MSIIYIPGGRPVSTSFAVTASTVFTSSWAPLTGSFAEYVFLPTGSRGRDFIIVTGSITTI